MLCSATCCGVKDSDILAVAGVVSRRDGRTVVVVVYRVLTAAEKVWMREGERNSVLKCRWVA